MQIQNKSNTRMGQSNDLEQKLNRIGLIIKTSIVKEYINNNKKIHGDLGTI